MDKMFGSQFGKFERIPSATPAEIEAARKAAEAAIKEKQEQLAKEAAEHEESERVRRLWQKEEAEKAGPHVITEEDKKAAEEKVGIKFEKLN
jgi:hypothetical protein